VAFRQISDLSLFSAIRVGLCLLSESNRVLLFGVVLIVSVPDIFTAACYTQACKRKAFPLQAYYMPVRVPGSRDIQISRQSAHKGGKVVSPMYQH